jgi:hypothetical protein
MSKYLILLVFFLYISTIPTQAIIFIGKGPNDLAQVLSDKINTKITVDPASYEKDSCLKDQLISFLTEFDNLPKKTRLTIQNTKRPFDELHFNHTQAIGSMTEREIHYNFLGFDKRYNQIDFNYSLHNDQNLANSFQNKDYVMTIDPVSANVTYEHIWIEARLKDFLGITGPQEVAHLKLQDLDAGNFDNEIFDNPSVEVKNLKIKQQYQGNLKHHGISNHKNNVCAEPLSLKILIPDLSVMGS